MIGIHFKFCTLPQGNGRREISGKTCYDSSVGSDDIFSLLREECQMLLRSQPRLHPYDEVDWDTVTALVEPVLLAKYTNNRNRPEAIVSSPSMLERDLMNEGVSTVDLIGVTQISGWKELRSD